ncbi:MAG: hypothetical protein WBB95_12140 [Pseudomonas sp.]|uniref:hypothetical protein n=1 Tax=Pseudomonas sp. TaxID=306 RepID=UPI003C76FC32
MPRSLWRGVIETLPASAGIDRRTARKALVRSPRRRLVEGGDVAIALDVETWCGGPPPRPAF